MTVLALAGIAAVLLFLHAAYRTAKERVYRVGLSRIIVRWLLGKPWHGQALTDAGWKREGRRALTRTGHASWFWHRPARERIAIRSGGTLAVLAVLYGLAFHRGPTVIALEVMAGACVAAGGWLAWRKLQWRKHRKSRLYPVHNALSPIVRTALPAKPESYLKIDRGGEKARWAEITLPPDFGANPNQMQAIVNAVTARLALEAPDPRWQLKGAKPK